MGDLLTGVSFRSGGREEERILLSNTNKVSRHHRSLLRCCQVCRLAGARIVLSGLITTRGKSLKYTISDHQTTMFMNEYWHQSSVINASSQLSGIINLNILFLLCFIFLNCKLTYCWNFQSKKTFSKDSFLHNLGFSRNVLDLTSKKRTRLVSLSILFNK